MASAPEIIEAPEAPAPEPAPAPAPAPSGVEPPAPAPNAPEAPAAAPEAPQDDWRTSMAGEDVELLKFLGRYHSQDAALKAWKKNHDEIRSGKWLKPLDENATDEEWAAFRKQMGVPDTVEAYLESLPNGLVVGEDDKPFVNTFLEKMHAANAPKAVSDAALSAYYEIIEGHAAAESEKANNAKLSGEDELRQEWGPDYRRNLNIMHSYLETLPEPVKEVFINGRGADGTPIGYNPEVLKWLTSKAMEENPVATVVPGAGSNQASAIADEMADLEKQMGDTSSEYWKGPKAAAKQARYLVLVEAKGKLK